MRALNRVCERTGYSVPVVEYAIDALFSSITLEAIDTVMRGELGSAHVEPVGPVAVVSSRTTIGVAIVPALFALCAGCDVHVKDREDALVTAFFETLAEEDSRFAVSARASQWCGEAQAHDLRLYAAVVAFGTDETLRAIRAQLAPGARFIPYGPKASIGYVTREALSDSNVTRAISQGAARDLVLYEGQGCLSLHALFVERNATLGPQAFAGLLASAIERANIEFPIGQRDAATEARIATERDLALFRDTVSYSNAQASFLLELGEPDRAPAFLPRVLAVHAVDGPNDMRAYVQRHSLPLEACAVAGHRDDVFAAAIAAGANRVAAFGELQRPPLDVKHGGRPRVAEFVR